jgi:uncharacterized surface protein with fasciclin (FAS1) repeats
MKKVALIYLLFFVSTMCTMAQVTPPRGSSFQDSVRSRIDKGKVMVVNGTAMNTAKDFFENLTASADHAQLLAIIRAASMVGTLKSRGPLTMFAPADTAITRKLNSRLDTLLTPAHKYELINILSYHIVPGHYDAKELAKLIKDGKGEAQLLTLSGSKLTARVDNNRNIVLYDETGGQSVISRFDIEQSNGLMHLVTQPLIPKTKAL